MGDRGAGAERPSRTTRRGVVVALAVVCLVLAVGCVVLLWQRRGVEATEEARQQALVAARQTATDLATIDHAQARGDVDRVLAGATGDFRDEFAGSADSLVSVVEQTGVTTVADRADAAVESWDGDHAVVLVQVSSTVTTLAAAEPQARVWRLRMTMERVEDGYKTAALEYLA